METFKIEGDYIELIGLLKAMGIAETGGHAKFIVEEGVVIRNVIEIDDIRIKLI
jgi:ribosome-associated protein